MWSTLTRDAGIDLHAFSVHLSKYALRGWQSCWQVIVISITLFNNHNEQNNGDYNDHGDDVIDDDHDGEGGGGEG